MEIRDLKNKKMGNQKKWIVMFLLIIISGIFLTYAAFTFSQSGWHNTQTHEFENGTGQIRLVGEFAPNSSKCGGDWTMYDSVTNLCWMMNSTTSGYNWTAAQNYCNSSTLANGNWRLPEKKELMTLLYHNGYGTTDDWLNSIGFNGIAQNYYWSNTKYSPIPSAYAYVVSFYVGFSDFIVLADSYYVLCVKTA